MSLAIGRVITARINGTENWVGCTDKARVNEKDMRADMPFNTIFQLLGRCPLEPVEVGTNVEVPGAGTGCWPYLECPLWVGLGPDIRSEPAGYAQKWVGSI